MTTLTSQVFNNINGGLSQTGNYSDHTYIWINAYYHIGTLNKGGTWTITNIKLEFNY
jgi:hypothetical protein